MEKVEDAGGNEEKRVEEKKIIEAVLFACGSPLDSDYLCKLISKPIEYVDDLIRELICEYNDEDGAIEIISINEKYMMQVKKDYVKYIKDLAPKEIEAPMLRTLSVIAYYQPINQSEVVSIRGNKAYNHIKELEKQGFIVTKAKGHTKIIETTDKFSEYFWQGDENDQYSDTKG